jgi:ABC-type phosphate transport system substrate-binding protein
MRYLFIFFLLLCSAWSLAEDRANTGVLAIVIPANQTVNSLKLTPEKLQLIYLRKQLYWPNGKRIQPVNLQTEHPLRKQFSQVVLGSLPAEQISYWNGLYFNGIRPPYVVNSEEAALRYVTQTEQAIAYINACNVDDRVQAILWISHDEVSTSAPRDLACSKP